jgi:hypothetical protein
MLYLYQEGGKSILKKAKTAFFAHSDRKSAK